MSTKRHSMRLLCAAAISALCGTASLAQTIQWSNTLGGTFSVGSNWTGGVAPGAGNSAQFNLVNLYTTTFTTSPTNINLNVSAGTLTFTTATAQAYNLTGSVSLSGGSLTSSGIQWDIANSLLVNQGSRLVLQSGSDMTVGSMLIGNSSNGTVSVTGSTSSLQTDNPAGTSLLGQNGAGGVLVFQSSAVGTFAGHLSLAQSGVANSTGVMQVISGADVTLAGNLNVGASGISGQVGDLFISSAGSTFTQTGASTVNIGAAANSVGTLFLSGGATFSSGTGTVTVNPTGYLVIGSTGTFTANGSVRINGGTLTRAATGDFIMPGGTLTVENGGSASFNGAQTFSAGHQINVLSGGKMFVSPGLTISNGVVATADGASSQLSGGSFLVGPGSAATFSNAASGTFTGDVTVGGSTSGGSALRVSTGGALTTGNLHIGTSGVAGVNAEISLNHGTSSITQTGVLSSLNIGTTAWSFGSLVISGGAFTSGTGSININSTGVLSIVSGTFLANGDININSGTLSHTGGSFSVAAGKNLTVGNVGLYDAIAVNWSNGGVLTLNGPSAKLTTSGVNVSGGGTMFILNGADATLTTSLTLGNTGGGALQVTGASSTIRATSANIGAAGGAGAATFSVDGNGTFTGALTVGSFGPGALSVLNSGRVTAPSLQIGGTNSTHAGTVTLDGTSSRININSGSVNLGGPLVAGPGTLLLNGGTFDAGPGAVNVYAGSQIISNGGLLEVTAPLTIDGGTLQFSDGNKLLLDGSIPLTLKNGGVGTVTNTLFTFHDSVYVIGPGTQLTADALQHYGDGTISVTGGAEVVVGISGLHLGVGSDGDGTLLVDGPGSRFSGGSSLLGPALISGSNGGNATVIFQNHSSGTFNGDLFLASTGSITHTNTSYGTFSVLGGSDVTFNSNMNIATFRADALFEVSGPGSVARQTGSATLQLSDDQFFGPATLSVSNGGSFIAPGNLTYLYSQSVVQITGGTVQLGTLNALGGQVQFNSGTFSYLGDLLVGPGGLLGANLGIDATKNLGNSGTTTINPGSSLNITGGLFKTGTIVNNGSFNWTGGSLEVTAGSIAIGSGGLISSPQNLDSSRSLKVGGQLSLLAGAQVNLVGGTLNAGSLNLAGTLVHEGGVFSAGAGTIQSAGRLFVESNELAAFSGAVSNAGRVELLGGAARVSAATFTNSGTLSGDGEIAAAFSNSGEVRGESGDNLLITSGSSSNSGRVNLLGGAVEFSGSLLNSGTISGRGALYSGGLTNTGTVSYSGGFADHFGTLTNNSGGKVIVTGGALVTFYNNVIANAGSEFRVSNGTAVFLGTVTGTTNFTGSGVKIFENTASPGPLATTGSTIVEIGGNVSVPHVREIALTLYGPMTISPNGTTGGTSRLNQLTIDVGSLDLNDNDLIIDHDGSSPIDEIQNHLFTGAIFSSTANASTNPKFALGYIESGGNGTFSGQAVDGTSLIIAYTLQGDGNLDGKVNTLDFNLLAGAFGQSNQHWINGDHDHNGTVNSIDFNAFIANYGQSYDVQASATLGATVPEPAGIAIVPLIGVLRRRGPRRCR